MTMTGSTSASTEVAELPRCGTCCAQMVLRDGFDGHGNGWTYEQRWCGTWYDHPPAEFGSLIGHTDSVLFPSAALLTQSAASAGLPK